MFAYLNGTITYKSPSLLHLDIQGLGYEINITLQTYEKIGDLKQCKLYTHLQIREDAWVLYGFFDEQERTTFRQLLGINGVGAATARIILSSLSTEELEKALWNEDLNTLQKIKGIGAKTAQRIILELKGKITSVPNNSGGTSVPSHNTIQYDALNALINLGINKAMAESALKKVENVASLSVEEIIKQALKAL